MATPEEKSSHRYPSDEFETDFLESSRILAGSNPQLAVDDVEDYFQKKYPNPDDANWKKRRCYFAGSYFEKNSEALNRGRTLVIGKKRHLIAPEVLFALWACFARDELSEDDLMIYDPPIAAFVKLCDQLIDLRK